MSATMLRPVIAAPKPRPPAIVTLDPRRVKPFADQPRKRFRGIKQLAASIGAIGQINPIVVIHSKDPAYDAELVDGERRLRACLLIGEPILALYDGASRENAATRLAGSVAANFCRQGHDVLEVMGAVLALRAAGRTDDEIAALAGKTRGWVWQHRSLAELAPAVLERLKPPPEGARQKQSRAAGKMTLSLALVLLPLSHAMQIRASKTILAQKMSLSQARTYIARLGHGVGKRMGKRIGPRKQFRAVAAAVASCHYVVERYLRMPGIEIAALVRNAEDAERKGLSETLERLCESLLLLSDELDRAPRRGVN